MLVDMMLFRDLVVGHIARQLNITFSPTEFKVKKIGWNPQRYKLALEFSNRRTPPLRIRTYIVQDGPEFMIGRYKLNEDPNQSTGPDDELYVTEVSLSTTSLQALIVYFDIEDDSEIHLYHDILLTDDGDALLTDSGDHIYY